MKTILINELSKFNSRATYIVLSIILLLFFTEYISVEIAVDSRTDVNTAYNAIADYFVQRTTMIFITLLPILVIIHSGRELKGGIIKKMLADTYSRKEYFLSKIILISFMALFSIVLNYIFYLLYSFILSEGDVWAIITAFKIQYFLIFYLVCFTVCAVGLFLILLLRNKIVAAILYFLYQHIEPLLRGLGENIEKISYLSNTKYLPINTIINPEASFLQQPEKVGLAVFYIVVFTLLSYVLIKKYQVK